MRYELGDELIRANPRKRNVADVETTATPTPAELKRARRLERMRLNSAKSRQKNKAYLSELEQKVVDLEADNALLRAQCQAAQSGGDSRMLLAQHTRDLRRREEQADKDKWIAAVLAALAKAEEETKLGYSGEGDQQKSQAYLDAERDISKVIDQYIERMSLYGSNRQALIGNLLDRFTEEIQPQNSIRFLQWATEKEGFFDPRSKSGGIWSLLNSKLKLTEAQIAGVVAAVAHGRAAMSEFHKCQQLLKQLKAALHKHCSMFSQYLLELRQAVPPVGQSLFVQWIEQNEALMQMIETTYNVQIPPQSLSGVTL
jgi:hypothetical protein